MTKWYLPWPDVMKIFWPLTVQLPSASCSPTVRSAAMSLPASGSVMSMQPQASPRAISPISSAKRVSADLEALAVELGRALLDRHEEHRQRDAGVERVVRHRRLLGPPSSSLWML